MKNYLRDYLLKLADSGADLIFDSVACRYGKFTIYCLSKPQENILQLTFAPDKHERLQKQLLQLNKGVQIRKLQQQKFHYNTIFAEYFAGKRSTFYVPLESPLLAAGTDFQQKVWHYISAVPYGSNITYQRLAQLAGSSKGARAAGMACGANPLALIIPCHRVVAVNGLGGFAGGVSIKKALLALEQSADITV
jgi:O-6-methylguanine DNA methyltransferase